MLMEAGTSNRRARPPLRSPGRSPRSWPPRARPMPRSSGCSRSLMRSCVIGAMIAHGVALTRRWLPMSMPPTARGNEPRRTSETSPASCRSTAMSHRSRGLTGGGVSMPSIGLFCRSPWLTAHLKRRRSTANTFRRLAACLSASTGLIPWPTNNSNRPASARAVAGVHGEPWPPIVSGASSIRGRPSDTAIRQRPSRRTWSSNRSPSDPHPTESLRPRSIGASPAFA